MCYKWDKKAGYLRTYPPGTLPNDRSAQPYPEGWLGSSGKVSGDDDTSTDANDDDTCSVRASDITVDTDTDVADMMARINKKRVSVVNGDRTFCKAATLAS